MSQEHETYHSGYLHTSYIRILHCDIAPIYLASYHVRSSSIRSLHPYGTLLFDVEHALHSTGGLIECKRGLSALVTLREWPLLTATGPSFANI